MKYLDDRYKKIYTHRGYDICTLETTPNEFGYRIDNQRFEGEVFSLVNDAIIEINRRESA